MLLLKIQWVLILRWPCSGKYPHSPYGYHQKLYNKVVTARDHGVGGILFLRKEKNREDKLQPLIYRQSAATAGLPIIQITHEVANEILKNNEKRFQIYF